MTEAPRTVHVARPKAVASWTFEIRERDQKGDLVARVDMGKAWTQGDLHVGDIPFEVDRQGLSRAYALLFEGQTVARAEPAGTLSNSYVIETEGGFLASGVEIGDRVAFVLEPTSFASSSCRFRSGEEVWGEIVKESMLFRHFALRFHPGVPLALQAFCLALMLARLRRQSNG